MPLKYNKHDVLAFYIDMRPFLFSTKFDLYMYLRSPSPLPNPLYIHMATPSLILLFLRLLLQLLQLFVYALKAPVLVKGWVQKGP